MAACCAQRVREAREAVDRERAARLGGGGARAGGRMTRPVRLSLDRLVLEGIAPRDQGAAVAAFRAELARLLVSGKLGGLGTGQVPRQLSVQATPAQDAASA